MWLVRVEPRRWVRRLGIAALAVVIAQGMLGGLTVKLMLPPSVSIAHACLAEAFFCITVALAFVTSERWSQPLPAAEVPQRQAGAAVRTRIHQSPFMRRSSSGRPFVMLNRDSSLHIVGAMAVFGCVIACLFVVLFTVKQRGFLRHAILLLCLVTAQIALGLVDLDGARAEECRGAIVDGPNARADGASGAWSAGSGHEPGDDPESLSLSRGCPGRTSSAVCGGSDFVRNSGAYVELTKPRILSMVLVTTTIGYFPRARREFIRCRRSV